MPRPAFDELPLGKGDPPYSAWGLYGPDDELGTLNLLTPEVVAEAAKEIRSGVRIGLDLPLDFLANPTGARLPLTHKIISRAPRPVFDDTVEFNTQVASQWDGYRHHGYTKSNNFYNGAIGEDIYGPKSTTKLGIHAFCKEGIAGRGILLDYLRWSESNGNTYRLLGGFAGRLQFLCLREGY